MSVIINDYAYHLNYQTTLQSLPEIDVFVTSRDGHSRVPWVAEFECQTPLYWKIRTNTEMEFFDTETLSWITCSTTSSVAPFFNFSQSTGGQRLYLNFFGENLELPTLSYVRTKYLNAQGIIKSEFDCYSAIGSIALTDNPIWSHLTIEFIYDGESLIPKNIKLKRLPSH